MASTALRGVADSRELASLPPSNHGRCSEPSRVWSGPIWRGSSNGRKKDVVISDDEPGHPPCSSRQADSLTCESMLACRRRRCAQVCMRPGMRGALTCPPATYLAKVRQWRRGRRLAELAVAACCLPRPGRSPTSRLPTHRWLVAKVGPGRYHAW